MGVGNGWIFFKKKTTAQRMSCWDLALTSFSYGDPRFVRSKRDGDDFRWLKTVNFCVSRNFPVEKRTGEGFVRIFFLKCEG